MQDANNANDAARDAWNANAHFWDERMGEGNEFFRVLVWPAVARLLDVERGARLLDICCGNGVASRRLAEAGANVVAIDFSEQLVALAQARSAALEIDYRLADATSYDALLSLGEGSFDGALCNMALMDLAKLEPLMCALFKLLRPNAAFVFSVLHPCFNNPAAVQMGEFEDRSGELTTTYSIKISRYRSPFTQPGLAMAGQPTPHPYFHRSIADLLRAGLEAGFVVDALEEPSFPPDHPPGSTALSWGGQFHELPPVLVVRMRRPLG